jgi:hypothetical protein
MYRRHPQISDRVDCWSADLARNVVAGQGAFVAGPDEP